MMYRASQVPLARARAELPRGSAAGPSAAPAAPAPRARRVSGRSALANAALLVPAGLALARSRRRSKKPRGQLRADDADDRSWQSDGEGEGEVDFPDLKLCLVMAGFSFDAYTEIDRAQGVWVKAGNQDQLGVRGVQTVLLSPSFVRDAFRGILRARVLSAEGLHGVAMAGAVAVFFRTTAGASAGGLQGFQRNTVRRGVLNGLAQWLDEDDSVYLYVPKGALADSEAASEEEPPEPCLYVEVHRRSLLDNSSMGILGTVAIPMSQWGENGRLKELCVQLEVPKDEKAEDGASERKPSLLKLQLEFDEFQELPEVPVPTGADEQLDDVTPEARYRRRRFGGNVPTEVRLPEVERYKLHQLEAALRRRGLPWQGDGRETLEKRLKTSIQAEKAIYDAGNWWNTVETWFGTDRKAQLEDAIDVASMAAETLSGDFFAALGAGFMSGANEIAGFGELVKGDFSGAMEKRKDVWKAAETEEGRQKLQQKADAAMKRAKQQAMIRLAQGMELMSVRKGAWVLLEQAVLDEGANNTCFQDYEQLAYLEAPSTNTECWVWRLKAARRLVVAFRGTSDFGDVLTDIAVMPRVIGDLGKVHEGFSRAYDSVREALHAVLARGVRGDGREWEIVFTGHSLGGALATLASLDVARTIRGLPADFGYEEEVGKVEKHCPLKGAEIITATFGAPRVGSSRVSAAYDEFVPRSWRIFSTFDVVPTVPPTSFWGFHHSGIGVELNPANSELTVRGRTANLKELAQEEKEKDRANAGQAVEEGSSLLMAFQGDIWSNFNDKELAELRKVLGTGTQAVGEHMEVGHYCFWKDMLGNR
ncbi:unnamed protein product [Effrenium voratum]|nr:unnamed protein product [Effrenium voratum]